MKKLARSLAINTIGFAGLSFFTYGFYLWSVPAGFIVGGIILVISALFAALPTSTRPKQ